MLEKGSKRQKEFALNYEIPDNVSLQVLKKPWLLLLTDVEEQDSPDRKSQSPQVVLRLGTPLKRHC